MAKRRRLMSEHFRPDGKPKQSFPSFDEARRVAARDGKRAYRCSVCTGYHVGGVVRRA